MSSLLQLARQAQRSITPDTAFLCAPLPAGINDLGRPNHWHILALWGFFNPFGPTLSGLALANVPNSSETLLFSPALNPFAVDAQVFGLVPAAVAEDDSKLVEVLRALFSSNGSQECPLFQGLPTYIINAEATRLSLGQLQELMFLVAEKSADAVGEEEIERLTKYKGRPWDRMTATLECTLEAAAASRNSARAAPKVGALSRAAFDRWWTLVTDPEHVHGELDELGNAWDGALETVKSGPVRVRRQLVLALTGASFIRCGGNVGVGPLLRISSRRLIAERASEQLSGGRNKDAQETLRICSRSLLELYGNTDDFRRINAVIERARQAIDSDDLDDALPMVIALLALLRGVENSLTV